MPTVEPALDRRTVWAWCLYDFGNSSFAVLFASMFSVYFKEEVVRPTGRAPDFWWGVTIAGSMLLVALSAPFVGGIADHTGRRKRLLACYTAAGLCAVLALTQVRPGGLGMVLAGCVLGALANVSFEGGIVFYNAYLPDIAPPSHRGRVSAMGFGVGYVGSLVALAIAWPALVAGHWTWLWVAIAVQWGAFSLPAFRVLPADRPTGLGLRTAALRGVRQTLQTVRDVWGMRDLRRFLIAYFVYMDGVITVIVFAASYASETLGFGTVELLGMLAIVQVTALVGSLAMGAPTDALGPRWAVRLMLVWWIGVVVAAFLAHGKIVFLVVAGLAGLGLGSIQSASRAFMARLIPPGRESELFGFYALCGKTGSILGPITFGVITLISGGDQRPAVLAVAVFYAVGLVLLAGVDDRSPSTPSRG